MGSRNLPENVDSAYADDGSHPDVKIHQQHHDVIHDFVNLFDDGAPPNGSVLFFNTTTGLWVAIDPEISGSPGPPGDPGQGFVWLGDWSGATTYAPYDVVRSGRHTYFSKTDHTNSQPTVDGADNPTASANWDVFTAGGTNGLEGPEGQPGDPGATGPPGPTAETVESHLAVSGDVTIDVGTATYHYVVPAGDTQLLMLDSSGLEVGQCTVEVEQAASVWAITWDDRIIWLTSDFNPPPSPDEGGKILIATVWRRGSRWLGNAVVTFDAPAIPAFPVPLGAGSFASGTGNITPGAPTSPVNDDIWLMFIENGPLDTPANPNAAEWTEIPTSTGFGNASISGTRLTVFWHRYAGSDPTRTVLDTGNHTDAIIHAFRGCKATGDPFNASASGGEGTPASTVTAPGLTTTANTCLIVAAIASGLDDTVPQFSAWTNGDLANVSEQSDNFTSSGNGGGIGVATGELATAGTIGATSATILDSSCSSRTIALEPA